MPELGDLFINDQYLGKISDLHVDRICLDEPSHQSPQLPLDEQACASADPSESQSLKPPKFSEEAEPVATQPANQE